jgi:hypothetical protein
VVTAPGWRDPLPTTNALHLFTGFRRVMFPVVMEFAIVSKAVFLHM